MVHHIDMRVSMKSHRTSRIAKRRAAGASGMQIAGASAFHRAGENNERLVELCEVAKSWARPTMRNLLRRRGKSCRTSEVILCSPFGDISILEFGYQLVWIDDSSQHAFACSCMWPLKSTVASDFFLDNFCFACRSVRPAIVPVLTLATWRRR